MGGLRGDQNRRAIRGVIALLVPLFAFSGCTSNFLKSSGKTGASKGAGLADLPSPDGSNFLVLSKVIQSSIGGGNLDLLGDGSGSIGLNCPKPDQISSGNYNTPSYCNCYYTFIDSTGADREEPADSNYVENDLLRCSTAKIPASVPYINVSIRMINNGAQSNSIRIKQPGISLDPANANTFVRAERYQCRDVVTIPYLFDTSVYDPIQSDDPRISFPMNFYTTNFGDAYSRFAAGNNADWNCPANPSTSDLAAGIDLTVYSLAPDALGSSRIFPPQGSENDRSTFYLAKTATGIFTIPVNAYMAPNLLTAEGGTPAPIGYGASPIPTGNGETCPDTSTQIPSGYKWVKVWLFRKSFDSRKFVTSQKLLEMQSVSCNPGNWASNPVEPGIISCGTDAPSTKQSGKLAARWFNAASGATYATQCVNFDTMSVGPCANTMAPGCTSQTVSTQYAGYSSYALGSDVWQPISACGGPDSYPMNICGDKGDRVPQDSNLGYQEINTDLQNPRFDFLFVVTPPTVMTSTMQNTGSAARDVYTPYRFLPGDCNSPDPQNPLTSGDCADEKRVVYGLKLHDVGENSDPSTGEGTNRPGVFPVCALQPI